MSKESNLNNGQDRDRIRNSLYRPEIPKDSEKGFPLLQLSNQFYTMDDLIVKDEVKEKLQYIIEENLKAKKLYAKGLRPKQRILFCGPPGTGKTFAAKIMSSTTSYPFVYVLFDAIVSSFLGETATNLRKIFSFIEQQRYVVLFDEFDIVGKKRDDPHEHGEIKRVVNNFIQMLDTFNGESIIIAATNHPHLLDTAIWRRFDEIIYFDLPDSEQRKLLFRKYLGLIDVEQDIELSYLTKKTSQYSPADIEQICTDARKKAIIEGRGMVSKEDLLWSFNDQRRRKSTILKTSS